LHGVIPIIKLRKPSARFVPASEHPQRAYASCQGTVVICVVSEYFVKRGQRGGAVEAAQGGMGFVDSGAHRTSPLTQ
jgi:hypothetical protein